MSALHLSDTNYPQGHVSVFAPAKHLALADITASLSLLGTFFFFGYFANLVNI